MSHNSAAEDLGDRKNPMPERDDPEHMPAEPLTELHGPFLMARGAEYQGLLAGFTAEQAPLRMRDITELLCLSLGLAEEGSG